MDASADVEANRERLGDRMTALVESSGSLIAFVSLAGELLYLNPGGRRILGIERATELRLSDLLPEGDGTWEQDILPRVLRSGEWSGERSFRNALDGAEVPMEVNAFAARNESGTPIEVLLEARDLRAEKERERERRELESRLHRAIKLEALGRLAGGIAHDFNNLLTAMTGFSEIVLDHLEPGHPLREGAEQALKRCERSSVIVQQLLAVSRRQELQPVVLDLNHQVQETLRLLRGLIGEDIAVATLLAEETLLVRADPAQWEQVLLNLLVNARDAMPRGGRLSVRTEAVGPDESHAAGRAVIQVTDSGEGMDRDTLERLFEPYFTTKERGSGLGLATVYGIVTQSGGTISVESRRGEGTTFSIELPRVAAGKVAPADGGLASGSRPRPGLSGKETILLVEDDYVVRLVVRETLRRAGYHVLEARDGNEALEVAARHDGRIELLLSDVVLPGMDGPSLARRVQSRHREMKILFMSGHDEDAVVHHGLPPEGGVYLEKPFTRETLTRKVRDILDS
jgi:PAS domain S-box-containing protein